MNTIRIIQLMAMGGDVYDYDSYFVACFSLTYVSGGGGRLRDRLVDGEEWRERHGSGRDVRWPPPVTSAPAKRLAKIWREVGKSPAKRCCFHVFVERGAMLYTER